MTEAHRREQQVLRIMRKAKYQWGAASICRLLHYKRRGPLWCPVGSPRGNEKCDYVPESSRRAVMNVLLRLERRKEVGRVRVGRLPSWVLSDHPLLEHWRFVGNR